jgi:hypothetical protein
MINLIHLGFELSPIVQEDFMSHQTLTYFIAITTEFDEDVNFYKQIFTINDRDLLKQLSFKKLDSLIRVVFSIPSLN